MKVQKSGMQIQCVSGSTIFPRGSDTPQATAERMSNEKSDSSMRSHMQTACFSKLCTSAVAHPRLACYDVALVAVLCGIAQEVSDIPKTAAI